MASLKYDRFVELKLCCVCKGTIYGNCRKCFNHDCFVPDKNKELMNCFTEFNTITNKEKIELFKEDNNYVKKRRFRLFRRR